jgi:predicted exporter
MPLSEDDQHKLDQIEQALAKDDPRFAEAVNIDRWRRRRIVVAGAAFTIGIVVLLVGLVSTQAVLVLGVIISIAGALTMTAAAALFLRGRRWP